MAKNIVFLLIPIWLGLFNVAIAQPVIPLDFVKSFGSPGDSLGQFDQPAALTADHNGHIYVADTGNHRVQKFDAAGQFIAYFGGIGSGQEQFDTPRDLNVRDGLNLYVADYNNHRIHRLDRRLSPVSIVSGSGAGNAAFEFSFPTSLTISPQGDLFIVEGEHNSVIKFNAFFTLIAQFGSIETGAGYLSSPGQIELLGDELLAVSDTQAGHLVLFDYFGNFVGNLGGDRLEEPGGLHYLAPEKWLLVADTGNKKIQGFSATGWVGDMRTIQTDPIQQWQSPQDITTVQNNLYVLDAETNSILMYKIISPIE